MGSEAPDFTEKIADGRPVREILDTPHATSYFSLRALVHLTGRSRLVPDPEHVA